jgi:hypothetical protein
VLLIVPLSVLALGAVAVSPPVKTKVPPLAPRVKVPVLLKVTASVIVPVLAFSAKLYAWDAVFKVVAVKAPLKVIVPVVLVKVTIVAPTVLLKVVPPELVMVRVPTPDTEEPLISAPVTPPVAKVKLQPAPVTAPIDRSAAFVVAFVLIEASAPSVIGPKVIASLLLLIVPLSVEALGAVAVKPPLKVKVPLLAPKAKVPLLLKVTVLVIVPVLAFRAKL